MLITFSFFRTSVYVILSKRYFQIHERPKVSNGSSNSFSTQCNSEEVGRQTKTESRSASGKQHHKQNKWRRYVLAAAAVVSVFIVICAAFTPLWLFHKDKTTGTFVLTLVLKWHYTALT